MRWLWVLAVAQLCATGVLIWKVSNLAPAASAETPRVATSYHHGASPSAPSPQRPTTDFPHEQAIRTIIREEIAAAQQGRVGESRAPQATPEPAYTSAFRAQFETVSSQVDTVLGTGRISEAEMETLHAAIGQLHPKDRRLLLSRLAKAINAGTVRMAH